MNDQVGSRAAQMLVVLSGGFVGGVYVGFPAALAIASRLHPRPVDATATMPRSVSVVIAAHDEAAAIDQKLTDVAAQRIAGDPSVQVIVASDGSADATVGIARAHVSNAMVLDLPRGGKAAALNAAMAEANGEVVVFTDANSRLGPEAFERLLAPFGDPDVGGVAGDQRYDARPSGTATSERSYWSYERLIKGFESDIGNVVSSTGTLHAIRRDLVDSVPGDVTDDFFLSTGVIEQGRRLVFAADAIAWEAPNDSAGSEYRRRVRIITRGLTGVRRRRGLLNPRTHGAYAVILFVHKVARRLVFVPLIISLLSSTTQRRRGRCWRTVWAAQMGFSGLAAVGLLAPGTRLGRHRVAALPAHFVSANAAAGHAVWNVMRSRSFVTWTPERS